MLAAEAAGQSFLFRTGPSFVRALAGIGPREPLTSAQIWPTGPPTGHGLVVVGSRVGQATRQLTALRARGRTVDVELDIPALLADRSGGGGDLVVAGVISYREGKCVSHPAFAARVTRIRTSPSLAAAARARELSASGRDVLDLTLGEPDFDTPRHIKDAAIAAIEAGQTKYTPVNGTPELRQAVISQVEKRTGIRYGDAEITVSGGAKQIIYLALAATLDHDDEVVIPAPYWLSYPDMVLANDGKPIIVPCPDTQGFLLTPEALDAAIGPRTRWVMLNTPGNPAGSAYTARQLRALADVLLTHPQVGILSDEIYDAIYFGSSPLRSIVSVEPELADRTLVVNGVSKAYAMTGWRIGYAAGPKGLIAAMNKLQGQISTCPSSISQAAAAAALQGDQSPVRHMTELYRKRRDLTIELLNTVPGLTVVPPAGAFYLFPHCGEILGRRTGDGTMLRSDEDVVLYLLDSVGVATVHGAAYGLSPHFRISFATSEHVLQHAVARIAAALADLR